MSTREHTIKVSLSGAELAVLDERRGTMPRAVFLRRLLHGPEVPRDIATHGEALGLLTSAARDGRVQAIVALERALREAGEVSVMDWIAHG